MGVLNTSLHWLTGVEKATSWKRPVIFPLGNYGEEEKRKEEGKGKGGKEKGKGEKISTTLSTKWHNITNVLRKINNIENAQQSIKEQ